MKIVFFGSSDFSVPFMEKIYNSRHCIVSVVTGPDKKRGRGRKVTANPVKKRAQELRLKVYEFGKLDKVFLNMISKTGFDLAVVVSFGMILPPKVFEMFPGKWINLHPSLLPRYRGPAPMLEALLNGDECTGVTINDVVHEVDTGNIYARTEFKLEDHDNMADLMDKVIRFGGPLLISVMDIVEDKKYRPYPQGARGVSYTRKITEKDLKIDWSGSRKKILNSIRAFSPQPGAYTFWKDLRLKILRAKVDMVKKTGTPHLEGIYAGAGTVILADRESGLIVECGDGNTVSIETVQPGGKKPMDYRDFINGYRIKAGDFFK
ncbi:MAG: methionyl-tRNA formyltransferase [Actinobacteria bacterium]|nr:methionyl-tRNA formyltransferase [Actinomycetota bacterium]